MQANDDRTRLTNIDALSALIDRLIVENIKRFFFAKEGLDNDVAHQDEIIAAIKSRITKLLAEIISARQYTFLAEHRTFPSASLIEEIESLIRNNINAGEAERAKMAEVLSGKPELKKIIENELRSRKANEARAENKNNIDELLRAIVNTDAQDDNSSPA